MPRNLAQLMADGENASTIREALDRLSEIDAPSAKWIAKIQSLEGELQAELQILEAQGRLF